MALVKCKNCGKLTNTVISDHIHNIDKPHRADKCYGALIQVSSTRKNYVKGCAYNEAPFYVKQNVDLLIENNLEF